MLHSNASKAKGINAMVSYRQLADGHLPTSPLTNGNILNGRYVPYELKNSSGTMFKVTDRISGEHLMMKKLMITNSRNGSLNEEQVWNLISESCNSGAKPSEVVIDDLGRYITFPIYGGNLEGAVALLPGPFPARHIREILVQLTIGMQFLHNMNIMHRDISPEKILMKSYDTITISAMSQARFANRTIFSSVEIRISGFGSAARIPTIEPFENIGTKGYRAPELCVGFEHTGAVDIFSAGIILFELVIGYKLFNPSDSMHDVMATMEDVIGPFSEELANSINAKYPGSLRGIHCETVTRPKIFDTNYPYREVICRMLRPEPDRRATVSDILRCTMLRPYYIGQSLDALCT